MRTRSQEMAEKVFSKVQTYSNKEKSKQTEYGSMAHKLPILIHQAGLAQAVEFVKTRDKDAHKDLLRHLGETLGYGDTEKFAEKCRKAELLEYIHLTNRALDALIWYKRFAKSVLGVEADEGQP